MLGKSLQKVEQIIIFYVCSWFTVRFSEFKKNLQNKMRYAPNTKFILPYFYDTKYLEESTPKIILSLV